ncbi:hypothetical protein [Proteiniborus sp. MB09-C3]|uniref:hypothetical protein n=1 Tax=Proteiniborus sp. MB09-C3 TaxID=3050072 RepID=UPI0025555929|nr:hypothetical protein [Proteiniborus sp. MB09-C3]WIV13261.1 hypothetical protein QO263_06005 [Proteiniborus sp. MB09-C3]
MKKKILVLLSVLIILSSFSSIVLAGEINPEPIREVKASIAGEINPEPIRDYIVVPFGEINPEPIRE